MVLLFENKQNCILAQQSSLGLAGRRLAFAWYDKIIASVMLILQISLFTCSPSLILPFIIDYKENCICKGVMLIGEDRQEVFSTCGHPPLRHLRASIFPTFQQEIRTFVTPAVWNSLFPRSIYPNAKQKTPKQTKKTALPQRTDSLLLTNLPSKIENHKNNIFLQSPKSSNLNPTLWKSSVSSPVSSSRILTRKRNICRRHFLFSPSAQTATFL